MDIKIKIILYIKNLISKNKKNNIDIETNIGRVVKIDNTIGDENLLLYFDDQRTMECLNCKISTLYQIVNHLKDEIIFNKIVNKIKEKKNHWDNNKMEWTHKPIDRKKILNYIENRGIRKNRVRLSDIK